MNKKNIEKEAPKYTSRLIVRLTPQLHKEIAEYAALCGLTTSAYARKRLEGKYPKQRLTDKEMEALNSLSDARGDIQKLSEALSVSIFLSIVFSKDPKSISEILLLPIGIVSMLLVEHSVICHILASCEVCTGD